MSVLIKEIEIPSKCIECKLMHRCGKDDLDYVCMPARVYVEDLTNAYKPRPEYCPLIPVPLHGRLIDVNTVSLEGGPYEYDEWCKWALEQYQDAPTIIPAEEGE